MKKIIDFKIYDTEKSEKIAERNTHCSFEGEFVKETLYKTEKGNFFATETCDHPEHEPELETTSHKYAFKFVLEVLGVEETIKLFSHLLEEG